MDQSPIHQRWLYVRINTCPSENAADARVISPIEFVANNSSLSGLGAITWGLARGIRDVNPVANNFIGPHELPVPSRSFQVSLPVSISIPAATPGSLRM